MTDQYRCLAVVCKAVGRARAVTSQQVADETGIPLHHVSVYLGILRDLELIERTDYRRWRYYCYYVSSRHAAAVALSKAAERESRKGFNWKRPQFNATALAAQW